MNSKEVVAGLKAKRAEAAAVVEACDTALVAFGEGGGGGNAKAKGKSAMQAAHDAMAVKRGTATPQQKARWEKRQAAKAKKAPKAAPEAEAVGASLAEAVKA